MATPSNGCESSSTCWASARMALFGVCQHTPSPSAMRVTDNGHLLGGTSRRSDHLAGDDLSPLAELLTDGGEAQPVQTGGRGLSGASEVPRGVSACG